MKTENMGLCLDQQSIMTMRIKSIRKHSRPFSSIGRREGGHGRLERGRTTQVLLKGWRSIRKGGIKDQFKSHLQKQRTKLSTSVTLWMKIHSLK